MTDLGSGMDTSIGTLRAHLDALGVGETERSIFVADAKQMKNKQRKGLIKWMGVLSKVVSSVVTQIKRNEIKGSGLCATQTCELLRTVVARGKFKNVEQLIVMVQAVGKRLISARPAELAIGNMVRRVLFMIRNESFLQNQQMQKQAAQNNTHNNSNSSNNKDTFSNSTTLPVDTLAVGPMDDLLVSPQSGLMLARSISPMPRSRSTVGERSLINLLDSNKNTPKPQLYSISSSDSNENNNSNSTSMNNNNNNNNNSTNDSIHTTALPTVNETEVLDLIKPLVIEEICDLVDEIKALSHSICDQAENHIYAEEVIMTFGLSKTVVAFLQAAAEFRRFYVFVAQSAPGYQGNQQAVNLAKAGIDVTVVPDSSVFAIMSHVSKVIIGTHAVLANGGLLAYSGAHNILLAAKHHAVPTLVLTGLYKLSPLYAFDGDTFNLHNPPSQMLDFENLTADQEPEVINPAFDYVPPELITLFITNNQGHSPFYIYRLLSEYYHPDDYDID